MDHSYYMALTKGFSGPRLSRYRPPDGAELDAVVNYFWNIQLSESLYPGLAALEVTLRSSIHEALTIREGTDSWFRTLLEPGQLKVYADAYLTLFNRHKRNHPSSSQIVAELTLGFWTTLLSQPYNQTFWAPDKTALVKAVFPHLPPTPSNRHFVHQRYNDLRQLRNRIMHHEPIWHRQDLHGEWERMIEAIGWINPVVRDSILLLDRFDDVWRHGRLRLEERIYIEFGF